MNRNILLTFSINTCENKYQGIRTIHEIICFIKRYLEFINNVFYSFFLEDVYEENFKFIFSNTSELKVKFIIPYEIHNGILCAILKLSEIMLFNFTYYLRYLWYEKVILFVIM